LHQIKARYLHEEKFFIQRNGLAGGFTYVKKIFGDNTTEIVMKGNQAAVTDPDGDWQSITNLENDSEGPGRFLVGMIGNFRAPAAQATNLVSSVKELKKDGDA
jgi:hypothetical protein